MPRGDYVEEILKDILARQRELEEAAHKNELEFESYRAREDAARDIRKDERERSDKKKDKRNAIVWGVIGAVASAMILKCLPLLWAALRAVK